MNDMFLIKVSNGLVSRLIGATRFGIGRVALVLCCLGFVLLSGCADETKFRPKVGGGLKRDTGDDPPPAAPPTNPSPGPDSSAIPSSSATAAEIPKINSNEQEQPTARKPATAGSANPPNSTAVPPRRVPVTRTRRSAANAAAPTSQMQLECNGKVLIRPLVLKPLLQASGRKTVWLLTSSAAEERAKAPAVCVRFETEGEDPEDWVGRPWSGQIFVQSADSRQVLGSELEGEVRLEFSVWDDAGVEGRILPGELQSSTGEKSVPYEGTFIATTEVSAAPEGESE